MGAGTSFELASQSALFELIERDALMFAWWTQSKPIEFDSLALIKANPSLQEIWMRFHKLQKSIRLRLLPTVLGDYAVAASYLSYDLSQGPFFTMSAAYRPRLEDALARALIELGQVLAGSRNIRKKTWVELENFDQALLNFTDHRSLYALPESEQLLGVFHHDSSGPPLNPDSFLPFSVSDFPFLLKEKGVQIHLVDLTAPELVKTGLKVVKAVSPQMIQLNPSHVSRAIGHPRLQGLGELWSAPHPFP